MWSKFLLLKKEHEVQESANSFLHHTDLPKSISRLANNLVLKYSSFFKILDKYEAASQSDHEFYVSLGLEKLFSQAALLQNEDIQEQEKAKFLTSLIIQFNKHKERKRL